MQPSNTGTSIAPAPIEPKKKAGFSDSIVDTIGRRFAAPVAIALDAVTLAIRVTEVSLMLLLPDVYAGWNAHTNQIVGFAFYAVQIVVILAISLGLTASLTLVFPLKYQVGRKKADATQIKNKRKRTDRLSFLNAKDAGYNQIILMSVGVVVLFSAAFFLKLFIPGWLLLIITAASDIAAPIVSMYAITQTEREYDNKDAQEKSMEVTTAGVVNQVKSIADRFGGNMSRQDVAILRNGIDGDIGGMLDAAVPFEAKDKVYTITEICAKLKVRSDRDSNNRKKVSRILVDAWKKGDHDVNRDKVNGRMVYFLAGEGWDRLFGSYQPSEESTPAPVASDKIVDINRTNVGQTAV